MSKQLHLEVVTPENRFFKGDVDMVILRTTEGDTGVLYNYEPTVAPLSIGALKIKIGEDYKVAACAGGFVNIEPDKVTVVTDCAEWADDIDCERAEASKERADKRLNLDDETVNINRARVSLTRAINRIRVAENYAKKG